MLEDTENWLYEDGEDQPKQVYEEKLDALKVCFYLFQVNIYSSFRRVFANYSPKLCQPSELYRDYEAL